MIKRILFLCFVSFSLMLQAQYTDVINSNNPGFSDSPYSVGTGIYQFENLFFYNSSNAKGAFSIPQSLGNTLTFRTSFFSDRLEFNTNFTFQRDKVELDILPTSFEFDSGVSDFTVGVKFLVYEQKYKDKSKEIRSWKKRHAFDWKRLIPSVAIYAGMHTNAVSDNYKLEKATQKVGVLLQNNFNQRFNLVSNVFYDYIGSDNPELSYIITGTYALSDRWSTFLEHQGKHNKIINSNNLGTGIAFLATRNLQVDAATYLTFNGNITENFTAIGISYRIDRHIHYTTVEDNTSKTIIDKSTKKKNFMGRFFNFFKFKKKKKN